MGEALFTKPLETLEEVDVIMVTVFPQESPLVVYGRAIRYVTLTENTRVGLRQVLRALDGGVSF
jgi:hypothetical protein